MKTNVLATLLLAMLLLTITVTASETQDQNGTMINTTSMTTAQGTEEFREMSFLQEDSILFMGELYLVWGIELPEFPENVKLSVGLVNIDPLDATGEIDPLDAYWSVFRESTTDGHYDWRVSVPVETGEGEYSVIVIVDHGYDATYEQKVYYTEKVFIVDPYEDV